jgi:hypothetical protein
VSDVLSNRHQKYYFWYQLFKTADTKNKSSFLVSLETIDRHHKKNLNVIINHFSSSVELNSSDWRCVGLVVANTHKPQEGGPWWFGRSQHL